MRHFRAYLDSRGQILFFSLIFTGIFLALSGGIISYTLINITAESQAVAQAQALALAEAGSDNAIYRLNQNPNYSGETNTALGPGTFTTTVTTINQNTKRITAAGNVTYGRGLTTSRTIQTTASIDITTISFSYGVQAGQGGLTMYNGSRINGNIFSNGTISGGNGTVTGDALVAGGIAPAPDQTWTDHNSDFYLGSDGDLADAAQSFVPSATNTIAKVVVYLKKIGDPNDLTIRIVSDDNDAPSKTVLASGNISASNITGNYAWIEGSLDSNPTLNTGQKYWLILSANVNSNKYYYWGLDTGNGYANNTGMYSDNWGAGNPVWTVAGGDFDFQIYMGATITGLSDITVNGNAKALSMTGCKIFGNAYFQMSSTCEVSGIQYPNTPPPSPQPFPISDTQITAWESAAAAGGTIGAYSLDSGATSTLGPVVVDGDFILNNNSTVKIKGPIWVKGNVTLDNGSKMIVDSSLGNNGTVLIADKPDSTTTTGKIILNNNAIGIGNGQPDSAMLFISTYAGVEDAVLVGNNASSSIVFAPYGTIHVDNNVDLWELTGYQIKLNNNAIVNYRSGLQNTSFSNGPGGSWIYQAGSYAITD